MTPPTGHPAVPSTGDIFATTKWSVVMAASGGTPQSEQALQELCGAYWYPLYAYIRRRGHAKEDAEDLTQAFFARFLSKNEFEGLSAERGRFRAFLLACLKHFLANERERATALKRGGTVPHLSLDWHTADATFQIAAADSLGRDGAYDREWAVALLARVLERLRSEHAQAGKQLLFDQLKPALTPSGTAVQYDHAATSLGMSHDAVRAAVHRLRRRYRELLREEIGQTLADPAAVDEEMRTLLSAFAR